MSNIQTRPEPFNWSRYQRTYNNAIDLVAQVVGYNRAMNKPLKAIYLKPTYHDLLRQGVRVLAQRDLDLEAPMYFDGVELKRGSPLQFDSVRCEYYALPKDMN